MVSVASLLNPVPSVIDGQHSLPSPCSTSFRSEDRSEFLPPYKKQKMSKDAAVFARGKVKGEVRYPPCEIQDEKTAAEHSRFHIYPMGTIAEYRRTIPYKSEKKSFHEKTGRGSFEGRNISRPLMLKSRLTHRPSLPVHFQNSFRREALHCDVGLQCWPSPHNSLLQMLPIPKGMLQMRSPR